MTRTAALALALAGALLTTASSAPAQEEFKTGSGAIVTRAPATLLPGPRLEVGTLRPGELRDTSLDIRNDGDEPLQAIDVTTSCTCVTAEVVPPVIDPGETGKLVIHIHAAYEIHATASKTIQVFFKGHAVSTNAVVRYESQFPLTTHVNVIDLDKEPRGRINVRSTGGEPFRILSINGEPAHCKNFDPEKDPPRRFYKLWYDFTEQKNRPTIIYIETDHPGARLITVVNSSKRSSVREKAFRKGHFRALRSMVNLGAFPAGTVPTFEMEALSEFSLEEGLRITFDDGTGRFSADIESLEEVPCKIPRNRRWKIRASLSPLKEEMRGPFYAHAVIQSMRYGYQAPLYFMGIIEDEPDTTPESADAGTEPSQ